MNETAHDPPPPPSETSTSSYFQIIYSGLVVAVFGAAAGPDLCRRPRGRYRSLLPFQVTFLWLVAAPFNC